MNLRKLCISRTATWREDLCWFEKAQVASEPNRLCHSEKRGQKRAKHRKRGDKRQRTFYSCPTSLRAHWTAEALLPLRAFSPGYRLSSAHTSLALPARPSPHFGRGQGFFWTARSHGRHQSTTLTKGSILPSLFTHQSYPNASYRLYHQTTDHRLHHSTEQAHL